MDGERHSFGWPGEHAPLLSKSKPRAKATPRRSPKIEESFQPYEEEREEQESWRRQDDFPAFPDTPGPGPGQQQPACTFFFSEQGCMYGEECRFSHEAPSFTQPVPIYGFFAQGYCRFGDYCSYTHVLPVAGQLDFDVEEGEDGEMGCFDEECEDEWFSGAASVRESEEGEDVKVSVSKLSLNVASVTLERYSSVSDDSWGHNESSVLTHTCTNTRTHTHTHAHKHTHSHRQTHTRTHTHAGAHHPFEKPR
jgi:hypothetical protein